MNNSLISRVFTAAFLLILLVFMAVTAITGTRADRERGLYLRLPEPSLAAEEAEEKDEIIYTLDSRVILSGSCEPGEILDVMVYIEPKENSRVYLYQSRVNVGKSGFYQLMVPLPVMGRQTVSVILGGNVSLQVYDRLESDLGSRLSSSYLNVYEFLEGK